MKHASFAELNFCCGDRDTAASAKIPLFSQAILHVADNHLWDLVEQDKILRLRADGGELP